MCFEWWICVALCFFLLLLLVCFFLHLLHILCITTAYMLSVEHVWLCNQNWEPENMSTCELSLALWSLWSFNCCVNKQISFYQLFWTFAFFAARFIFLCECLKEAVCLECMVIVSKQRLCRHDLVLQNSLFALTNILISIFALLWLLSVFLLLLLLASISACDSVIWLKLLNQFPFQDISTQSQTDG